MKEFSRQSLRAHVLTCLSLSYLSDDVREEDSAPFNVEPSNDNISESNRGLEVSNNISGSEALILPTLLKLICQQIQF